MVNNSATEINNVSEPKLIQSTIVHTHTHIYTLTQKAKEWLTYTFCDNIKWTSSQSLYTFTIGQDEFVLHSLIYQKKKNVYGFVLFLDGIQIFGVK